MKLSYLLKYSVVMIVLVLILFLVLSIFTYFFSYNKIINYAYCFITPICIFVVSLLYARKTKERGLLRGLEVWAVYFLIVSILKYTLLQGADINIVKQFIFIPVAILGGILGVNIKWGEIECYRR